MKRTWTEQSIREWIQRRDDYRERWRLAPLASLRDSLDPEEQKDYKDALSMERRTLLVRLHRYYTATLAWPVRKIATIVLCGTLICQRFRLRSTRLWRTKRHFQALSCSL